MTDSWYHKLIQVQSVLIADLYGIIRYQNTVTPTHGLFYAVPELAHSPNFFFIFFFFFFFFFLFYKHTSIKGNLLIVQKHFSVTNHLLAFPKDVQVTRNGKYFSKKNHGKSLKIQITTGLLLRAWRGSLFSVSCLLGFDFFVYNQI